MRLGKRINQGNFFSQPFAAEAAFIIFIIGKALRLSSHTKEPFVSCLIEVAQKKLF